MRSRMLLATDIARTHCCQDWSGLSGLVGAVRTGRGCQDWSGLSGLVGAVRMARGLPQPTTSGASVVGGGWTWAGALRASVTTVEGVTMSADENMSAEEN